MKALTLFIGLILYSFTSIAAPADGNLPGDNLDLNAVLELFKKSKSVEDFEIQLNSEKSNINNLDLNDDGFVDYIRVVDYVKNKAHLITLQVAFSADDIQDVAVIQLDQDDNKTVVQIVGNEAIYGRDFIVEPKTDNADIAYNANSWTSVRYIYGPQYVVYVSPWYYGFYPGWHRPWRPYTWNRYWGYVYPYHSYYRHCGYYRNYHANTHYQMQKHYSKTYYNSPKHKETQKQLPVNKKAATTKNAGQVNKQKQVTKKAGTGKTVRTTDRTSPTSSPSNTTRTKDPIRNDVPRPQTGTTRTPTRTSPTRTQPTRTSPTRTQPTRTQPRTQPTRTSPTSRPTTRPSTPTKQPRSTPRSSGSSAPSKKRP